MFDNYHWLQDLSCSKIFAFSYVDCTQTEYLQRLCLTATAGLGFLSDIGFKQANGGAVVDGIYCSTCLVFVDKFGSLKFEVAVKIASGGSSHSGQC